MIKISTFNIQNDFSTYSIEKTNILFDYLKSYQIDILGIQEMYSSLEKDFNKKLRKLGYRSVGSYRFYSRYLLNRFNEKTPIVTKYPILSYHTYHLPFLPSFLKRIITKADILIENKEVAVYNTHLDFKYNSVKERQLKKILKILKKEKKPIILMGDFNLKTNKEVFLWFIEELKKMNIIHIDVHDKTLKASQYHRAIDHIFLSSDFRVIKKERIVNIPISDHYPVFLEIDFI